MKHVKTSAGFEADVDEKRFNNMELLDAIVELEKGNTLVLSRLADLVLGDDKQRLYDAVRDEDGIVPIDLASAQINEIMLQVGGKNS